MRPAGLGYRLYAVLQALDRRGFVAIGRLHLGLLPGDSGDPWWCPCCAAGPLPRALAARHLVLVCALAAAVRDPQLLALVNGHGPAVTRELVAAVNAAAADPANSAPDLLVILLDGDATQRVAPALAANPRAKEAAVRAGAAILHELTDPHGYWSAPA